MGDGIIEGYAEMGFGDVAAAAIYGHEFAHHIQFQNGYFNDPFPTAAERTRYTELMADAMSAYFMTHKRGMSFNRHRVAQFLEAFFNIGDCGFTSSGHHGTPNQRMRAAQFGFDIANGAHKQGHILSSQAFYELFVAEYPNIIAPDAI
jgi:predicted metalloprotease